MIIRIVTMTFTKDSIVTFLEIFETYKSQIRNAQGCTHLRLIQNINHPEEISTYSHWNSQADLDHYRNSEVFKTVWPKTKALFNEKPRATSYNTLSLQE